MRYEYHFRFFAVAAVFLALCSVGIARADDTNQPEAASKSPGEIRFLDSMPDDARQLRKEGTPTPAKRETGVTPSPRDEAEQMPTPAVKPSPSPAEIDVEPLVPIADPMESPPVPVETASFKGITPGVSTRQDVEKTWGTPKDVSQTGGFMIHLYSVDPFDQVEVSYAGEKVSSIVIRLGRAFPADAVAKQLDLSAIRPVLVSNELGEIIGIAYPERGVLFAFEQTEEPGKPTMKVLQIILESVTAEAFVLRAETTMENRYDLSRRDLEQALKLEPDNARARWLLGRVLAATENHEKAMVETGKAVRLDPDNPQYRTTHAQVLAQIGNLLEAVQHAQRAAEISDSRPHIKARAVCLLGDLLASGAEPDFNKALSFHIEAIKIADPLCDNQHPAIRIAAKEVIIDAHLGAAHDIAWGEFKQKGKAVVRWLDRAKTTADDLVENEKGNPVLLFHVCTRTLSAYVGVRGEVDPEPAVTTAVEVGERLIASARDPGRKTQLQWELGTALYDAVQIYQMRSENDKALKYGQAAADYLAEAMRDNPASAASLLLGRLYFRLGAIHSLGNRDHKAAVVWFDKALPLLDGKSAEEVADNLGRHGESLVSMGVSYWQIGQREKAVELTEKGIRWMEQAVRQGSLDRSTLSVPYENLAAMHRKLGNDEKAERLQQLAGRIKEEMLK